MRELEPSNAASLSRRLFAPSERLGWQYVDPGRARPSPRAGSEPQWEPPPPPDLRELHADQADLIATLPPRAGVAGLLVLLGLLVALLPDPAVLGRAHVPAGLLCMLLGAGLITVSLLPLGRSRRRAATAVATWERRRTREREAFDLAHAEWQASVRHWDSAEELRRQTTPLWYPVELGSAAQRVDVFGGTADGWSGLLCTAGATLLESDTSMLVADFTEEDVTGPLCALAALRNIPVRRWIVPAHLEAARLLHGLTPADVAELVAESAGTLRAGTEDVELRMIDAGLIGTVASRLDAPSTFGRLAAGLAALQQTYDLDHDQRLTLAEFQRISDAIDTALPTERARAELHFLHNVLTMLGPGPSSDHPDADGDAAGLWPTLGLSVLRTEDTNRRRRDLVDRLLAQVMLHGARHVHDRDGELVLVLAGADHIGAPTLELLARRCRRAGIRLILMLEHLRGDLEELLGSSDSLTVFMRLGNAQQAAAAAEHIGRGHRFLLTQLSRQTGRTDTSGTSHSEGTNSSATKGLSRSLGRSARGWLDPPTTSTQTSVNLSRTTGGSTQDGTTESTAVSATDGQTLSRVYEFTVEPAQIQAMDTTSFLFVGARNGERQVVAGDCDPYLSLMPRVSAEPLDRDAVRERAEAYERELAEAAGSTGTETAAATALGGGADRALDGPGRLRLIHPSPELPAPVRASDPASVVAQVRDPGADPRRPWTR